MSYEGFCIQCNATIEGETKKEFGDALIKHHKKNASGGIICRCSVFQCIEKDENGKIVGGSFGLEATMDIVFRAWTGTLWYEKDRS